MKEAANDPYYFYHRGELKLPDDPKFFPMDYSFWAEDDNVNYSNWLDRRLANLGIQKKLFWKVWDDKWKYHAERRFKNRDVGIPGPEPEDIKDAEEWFNEIMQSFQEHDEGAIASTAARNLKAAAGAVANAFSPGTVKSALRRSRKPKSPAEEKTPRQEYPPQRPTYVGDGLGYLGRYDRGEHPVLRPVNIEEVAGEPIEGSRNFAEGARKFVGDAAAAAAAVGGQAAAAGGRGLSNIRNAASALGTGVATVAGSQVPANIPLLGGMTVGAATGAVVGTAAIAAAAGYGAYKLATRNKKRGREQIEDVDAVGEHDGRDNVNINEVSNNSRDINVRNTLDGVHRQPADTMAPNGVTVSPDPLERASGKRYGLDGQWEEEDYRNEVMRNLKKDSDIKTLEDTKRESDEGFDEKDRSAEGDELLLAPVDRALPSLRPEYGVQGADAVIPSKGDQLLSSILFDQFSIVRPGFGEGETNKLFVQQENWKNNIQWADPLYSPGTFEGITNTQHPLPWIFQTVKTSKSIDTWKKHKKQKLIQESNAYTDGQQGSNGILGYDVGLPASVSTSGLRRPAESVLEPIINNRVHWEPVFDPAGIALNKRGFKRPTDSQREPLVHTVQLDMGGPHFKPSAEPLNTYLFPF